MGHIQGLPGILRNIMIMIYEIDEMGKHENCRQGREIFTSFSSRGHGSGDQVQERNATDHEGSRASEMAHFSLRGDFNKYGGVRVGAFLYWIIR